MSEAPAPDLSSEAGYSLIEMVITMAILSVVLGALSTLFVQGSKSETELNNRFQAQQGARNAVDLVRRDGHRACSVTSASGTSITFNWVNTASNPPNCTGGTAITWCTRASGSKWALYRVSGSACGASGGTKFVDSVTSSSVFTFTAAVGTVGGAVNQHTLAVLKLDIPVNVTSNPLDAYRLVDDVALRNTVRA